MRPESDDVTSFQRPCSNREAGARIAAGVLSSESLIDAGFELKPVWNPHPGTLQHLRCTLKVIE